jgi:hypothetical protein
MNPKCFETHYTFPYEINEKELSKIKGKRYIKKLKRRPEERRQGQAKGKS